MTINTGLSEMFDTLIAKALLAGIGMALITGSIGCFVIWKRMAYFGDALAHSGLLGIALGTVLGFGAGWGIFTICAAFAVLLLWFERRNTLHADTILGVLAHATISFGMIILSLLENDVDIHDLLFGNILTVSYKELFWIYGVGLIVLPLLIANWSSLVLMAVHKELAIAENVPIFWMQVLLVLLLAAVVAASVRIVGILLVTAMLIIPPASAKQIAHTPVGMAILSVFIGIASAIIGIFGSIELGTPVGPSIVATSVIFFILVLFSGIWFGNHKKIT